MANPAFTRVSALKGPTTAGVCQATIVPTYTAASAGGKQVAVVMATQNSGDAAMTCSGPGGNWVAKSTIVQGVGSTKNLYIFTFENDAVDAATSATFTPSRTCTPFAIVYEFATSSGQSATTFSAFTTSNGASATTGSGTAPDSNDYNILVGMVEDANFLTSSAIAGYTTDANGADHGNGGVNSNGCSVALYHANAVNGSTTISSQTITWTGANATSLGATLLMTPSVTGGVVLPNLDGGMQGPIYSGGMAA